MRKVRAGAIAGIVGGMVFGMMMGMMGMLPVIAGMVGSTSAVVGFGVHLVISAMIGAGFGIVLAVWFIPNIIFPFPNAIGYQDMVFNLFGLLFTVLDVGVGALVLRCVLVHSGLIGIGLWCLGRLFCNSSLNSANRLHLGCGRHIRRLFQGSIISLTWWGSFRKRKIIRAYCLIRSQLRLAMSSKRFKRSIP